MYTARLICSDPDCADGFDAEAGTQEELDSLVCDCGCALLVLGWPDWDPAAARAQVVPISAVPATPAAAMAA